MDTRNFIPLDVLALKLALPGKWLRQEVDAGRIPYLQVGRRRLFDLETVRAALAKRSAQEVADEC